MKEALYILSIITVITSGSETPTNSSTILRILQSTRWTRGFYKPLVLQYL